MGYRPRLRAPVTGRDRIAVASRRSEVVVTKKLDPEIKGLRALNRAVESIPEGARQRCLEWLIASRCGLTGVRLPKVKS